MAASVQLEYKITGCESQGACRQDELIGGKPPVVKQLSLSPSLQCAYVELYSALTRN
jgi:hypothetical protein